MRKFELLAATAFAMIAAQPAWAQTTGTSPTNPTPADAQNDPSILPPAATAEGAPSSQIPYDNSGEVVVTASKREATLQDTPISVSVTSAETIERAQVRDLLDLQTLVPSLRVGQLQSSANTSFFIRGFGNGANNAGIEPSVGVFIDGVYRSRSAAQIGDLPNITRVEVLRGPQSTLFGKNASAGIISIVTEQPQFKFGGGLDVSYGNFDARVVKGDVTGPITDTIAFSLAGNYNKRDGYGRYINLGIKNNTRDRYGVRGQLLFEPSSDFKLRLIGDYDNIDEICCSVANVVDGPTGAAVRAVGGQLLSNQRFAYDGYANIPSTTEIDNYGGSAQADWNVMRDITVTSITAYRELRSDSNADSDFTSADLIGQNILNTDINTFTQELRIVSSFDGPINFLLGGFYFKEDIDTFAQLTFGRDFRAYANALSGGAYSSLEPTLRALLPGTPAGAFGSQGQGRFENFDYSDKAISAFGQVDFEPIRGLTLTGGFNYTHDKKRVASNITTTDVFSSLDLVLAGVRAGVPAAFANTAANPFLALRPLQFLPPFLNFPNAVESGRTKDSDWSYTGRISYKMSRHLNAYATYATGFKASSFNLSFDSRPTAADFIPGSPAQSPAPAASPIRNAGLAVNNLTTGTRFAGPEDATVYEIGLKGSWSGFSFNVALFDQTLKGFQSNIFQGTGFVLGNAEKQSTQGVEIDASLSPTRNLNFTASLTYLDPKYDLFTGGSAFNPATNTVVPTNLTGRKPSGISDYTVSVATNYTLPITGSTAAIFHVDYQLSGSYVVAQGLSYKASPESLNASVAFTLAEGLQLGVYGRNLTRPRYNAVIFPGVAQAGTLSGYPSPPRTYGVSARYEF